MLKFLQYTKVPIILLLFVAGLEILAWLEIIPPSNDLAVFFKALFENYGLVVLGPLALLENLAILNIYFPGSIVILTSMALSTGNPKRALSIFIIYYIFANISYAINIVVGSRLVKTRNPSKLLLSTAEDRNRKLWLRFLLLFSHPQLASILCVEIGSEGLNYNAVSRYVLFFSFMWTAIWSLIMYYLGTLSGSDFDLRILVYVYLLGLLVIDINHYRKGE